MKKFLSLVGNISPYISKRNKVPCSLGNKYDREGKKESSRTLSKVAKAWYENLNLIQYLNSRKIIKNRCYTCNKGEKYKQIIFSE